MKYLIAVLVMSFLSSQSFSQHTERHHTSNPVIEHHNESFFRTSLSIAHTYLPQNTIEGREILVLPSFGVDFEYWFNHKIGVGLHNDLELLIFEIQDMEGERIEREFPLLSTLDILWMPVNNISLYFGPGIELERNKNFFVFRVGVEGEIPINDKFDVAPILFYDFRDGAYNTLSMGIGLGYHF